jgi:hypothetical protein
MPGGKHWGVGGRRNENISVNERVIFLTILIVYNKCMVRKNFLAELVFVLI